MNSVFVDFNEPWRLDVCQLRGPKWRRIRVPGVFVQGVCHDMNCEANGCLVVCNPAIFKEHRKGQEYTWPVLDPRAAKTFCPCCGADIQPTSLGFTNCFFNVVGIQAKSTTTDDAAGARSLCINYQVNATDIVSWNSLDCRQVKWHMLCVFVQVNNNSATHTECFLPTPLEDEQCAICLDRITGPQRLQLRPCPHAFHRECVLRWHTEQSSCRQTKTCPMCRQKVG